MNKKFKTSYVPPQIEVFHVEMEHSIAAASVTPHFQLGDDANTVVEEWEEDEVDFGLQDYNY